MFISQLRIPEIVPNAATGRGIKTVYLASRVGMQAGEKSLERGASVMAAPHKVVVIGENGPGFELPTLIPGQRKEMVFQ